MDIGELRDRINDIDVEDVKKIGTAPKPVQYGVLVVLFAAVLAGVGWFLVKPKVDELERTQAREEELLAQLDRKQQRAANLDAYKEQLAEMEETFGAMLRQLPDETDMESLIVDLSQTSIAAGLDIEFFQPQSEVQQDFYAEYPIELRVSGRYHEFGNFVSGLAALPRIVTLHNIAIEPSGDGNSGADSPQLRMTLTARTYRYLDDGEAEGNGQ